MALSLQEQFEGINGRLIETRKAIEERDRILSLLDTIDRQLAEKIKERDLLVQIAQQEKADVDQLEGLSVTAVFAKLFRNHEQKLEKEVAEYLEIKMGLEAEEIAIQSLQSNHQELEIMLVALADCDEEHKQAQLAQKQFLIEHQKVNPKKLAIFPELMASKEHFLQEIDEALKIAFNVDEQMRDLFQLIAHSRTPKLYTTTGNILSKTLTSDVGYYTGTGRIVIHASEIQPQLKLLQLELEDIDLSFANNIDLQIPKFSAVMTTDGDQNQETRRLRNFVRWIKHLGIVHDRLQQKIIVLKKKRQVTKNEILNLQTEQQALLDRLWKRVKNFIFQV